MRNVFLSEAMVLGVSHTMSHKEPKEWADKHRQLGCKTVIFPVNSDAPDSLVFAYEEAAKDAGLSIAEVGVWNNPIDADLSVRAKNREYCVRQLELAEAVKARCCVNVVGAFAGERWDGGCAENFSQAAFDCIVESVQEIIDKVKPVHTKYSLEPMPWMLPTGPDEYLKLIEAIKRDAFGVHMDLVNMINCPERYFFPEQFMQDCFTKLKGKICSCHIKDIRLLAPFTFQLEECACGDGVLPLETYAKLAGEEDEKMPMIIEHLSSEQAYLDSMKYVKERLKEFIV